MRNEKFLAMRRNTTRIFALGVLLLFGCGLFASADGKGRRSEGPVDAMLAASGTTGATAVFIRTGELVAERNSDLFQADLLQTYGKVLGHDERNLNRLYLRCDRNWGATAYALALQAASKEPLQVVLMNYDAAGRNWEWTALAMRKLSQKRLEPVHSFGTYLNQQLKTWSWILESPMRWRETYLGPEGR